MTELLREQRHQERDQRKKIVIWRKPLTTLHYFIMEVFELIKQEKARLAMLALFLFQTHETIGTGI